MGDQKKALVFGACAITALALGACQAKVKTEAPKPALTVSAEVVQTLDLNRQVEASGTVAAWRDVPVGAEAGGLTAVEVNVDEGSRVTAGQVLVRLDDRLLQAQVRQQRAAVASAKATLAKNEAALKRSQKLETQGYLAKANLDIAIADQQTAEAQVQTAEGSLAETLAKLDQTVIRAPVSGLVSSRTVVKGQIVTIGAELLRIVRDDQLELNAQIPEADLPLVRAGATARVTDEQGHSTTGRVRLVTPQVDTQTRLALARITLPVGSGFSSGEFGRAVIDAGQAPTVAVSQDAIVFRDGKPNVLVIDQTNHLHQRAVATGERGQGYVAILSGLSAGERVAVAGAGFLGEGDLVRIKPSLQADRR
jgi:RND family efflux transporter MFP subunit